MAKTAEQIAARISKLLADKATLEADVVRLRSDVANLMEIVKSVETALGLSVTPKLVRSGKRPAKPTRRSRREPAGKAAPPVSVLKSKRPMTDKQRTALEKAHAARRAQAAARRSAEAAA